MHLATVLKTLLRTLVHGGGGVVLHFPAETRGARTLAPTLEGTPGGSSGVVPSLQLLTLDPL